MMKNRFLFVAMLFAALSLGFASCDNNKGNNPDDPTTGNDSGKEKNPTIVPTCTDYVDLGLSVNWATCNVGATKPEEYGSYYAWGEVEPKEEYNWDTYKWATATWDSHWEDWVPETLTKYCTDSDYGTVDNKTVLDPEDDAAAVNMGGSWRMPTKGEWMELREECTWEEKRSYKGTTAGYLVTSKANGNSIFLPAAGYRGDGDLHQAGSDGFYWSNSFNPVCSCSAFGFDFSPDYMGWDYGRHYGFSVRGVCP